MVPYFFLRHLVRAVKAMKVNFRGLAGEEAGSVDPWTKGAKGRGRQAGPTRNEAIRQRREDRLTQLKVLTHFL